MDPPRLLTPEEIETVLDRAIPAPGKPRTSTQADITLSADRHVALAIYENTRRLIRQQLKCERIAPAALDRLVEVIARRLTKAQVAAGETVGGKCGEAMGAPVTQMALNTFHQSGSGKDVGGGIDGLRVLLNMNETRYPQCFLHFKNKQLSERDVVSLRKDYVSLAMASLIKDYDIALAQKEGEFFIPAEYGDDTWWFKAAQSFDPDLLRDVSPSEKYKNPWYIRLELKVDLMVEYGITPENILRTIQTGILKCISGPMRTGIMYIFVVPGNIPLTSVAKYESALTDEVLLYLQTVVMPMFQELAFRGLPGISKMLPMVVKTTNIVAEEVPAYTDREISAAPEEERTRMQHTWRVILHAGRIKTSGVKASTLATLFKEGGCTATVVDPLTINVILPTGSKGIPSVFINKVVADAQNIVEERRKQTLLSKQKVTMVDPPVVRASQYVYGHAFGSGLLRALIHPDLDPYFTYSNEISVVYDLFGIEAARNLWILLFSQAMEQAGDTSTDPRHIIMAADILFNQGRPLGITYRGISRQKGSTLAMITVEKAMEGISKVASVGGLDNMTPASASIMVGRRGEWGTGYAIDVLPDAEATQRLLGELHASKTTIPPETLKTAIDTLVLKPEEDIPLTLTEEDMFAPAPSSDVPALRPKAPTTLPKPSQLARTSLPPTAQELVRPVQVSAPALMKAADNVAVFPSMPQGAEALVFVTSTTTKKGGKTIQRFIPPQVALLASDTSGSTSVPWELGMPVPDFVPLELPTPSETNVAPIPQPQGAMPSRPSQISTPQGLPLPIDAEAWIRYMRR